MGHKRRVQIHGPARPAQRVAVDERFLSTAIKVAILLRNQKLIEELQKLVASFRAKGNAFLKIVKMGRTELQDAVR